MMPKRIFSLLSLLLVTAFVLIACNEPDKPQVEQTFEECEVSEESLMGEVVVPPASDQFAAGAELKILQRCNFVSLYDNWFKEFAQKWGEENGVKVTVEYVKTADLLPRVRKEIEAEEGHDLIEFAFPPSQFEKDMVNLIDLNVKAQEEFGKQSVICTKSSFNPNTGTFYGFAHGWVSDPGNYRQSMWEKEGLPSGPSTYPQLLESGQRIKNKQNVPIGIGMSEELDSNMAIRAVIWSFGGSVQDENENVIIKSPETVDAVEYMAELYRKTMTEDVFMWNTASNNEQMIAGKLSYILNSISAYRTAQEKMPEVADDIFFVPPLKGPDGIGFVGTHVMPVYSIPKFSNSSDAAQAFLLDLVRSYDQAVLNSKLYNFPCWPDTVPDLMNEGGWLDKDPFSPDLNNKLAVLKNAEKWTKAIGHPGPANPAIGQVFEDHILPQMVAKAARDEMSAEDAVEWAEGEITRIFEQWRAEGLVGSGQ